RKLIAAEPRDLVAGAKLLPETLSDLLQKQVAVSMTEGVVDFLEAIEVNEQQTGRLGVGPERFLHRLPKRSPVGQAGQWVVARGMLVARALPDRVVDGDDRGQ